MTMSYFANTNYLQNENDRKNAKYRRKYRNLKQRVVGLLIENAALCDEVAKVQETIVIIKEERRFLLRKLLEYEVEGESTMQSNKSTSPNVHTNGPQAKKKKREDHSSMSAVDSCIQLQHHKKTL